MRRVFAKRDGFACDAHAECRTWLKRRVLLPFIASHNCHKLRQLRKIQADGRYFLSVSAAFCLEYFYFVLADEFVFHHIVAARYRDLLIARPPPFLGVSSLNLAALTSGHFFWRSFWLLAASLVAHWQSQLRSSLLTINQNASPKIRGKELAIE